MPLSSSNVDALYQLPVPCSRVKRPRRFRPAIAQFEKFRCVAGRAGVGHGHRLPQRWCCFAGFQYTQLDEALALVGGENTTRFQEFIDVAVNQ